MSQTIQNLAEMRKSPPVIHTLNIYAYRVLKDFISTKGAFILRAEPALEALADEFHYIYVTLYYKGELRGCQRNKSLSAWDTRVKEAITGALTDKRFGRLALEQPITTIDSVQLMYFLIAKDSYPIERLDEVLLGVSGLHMVMETKALLKKEEVTVKFNYQVGELLEAMRRKGLLTEAEQFKMLTHDISGFTGEPSGTNRVFRGDLFVSMEDLNFRFLMERLEFLLAWFIQHWENDCFHYIYEPRTNIVRDGRNYLREMMTFYMVAMVVDVHEVFKANQVSRPWLRSLEMVEGLLALMKKSMFFEEMNTRLFKKDVVLGEVAFSLMFLTTSGGSLAVVHQLANSLKKRILNSGEVQTYTKSNQEHARESAPGQTLLALAVYGRAYDPESIRRVEFCLGFYEKQWAKHQSVTFAIWQIEAFAVIERELASQFEAQIIEGPIRQNLAQRLERVRVFVFQMADFLLTKQHWNAYPDEMGAISDPGTFTTAQFAEALFFALDVAVSAKDEKRTVRYEKAFLLALRFSLQLQLSPLVAMQFPNRHKALGGMRTSLLDSTQRLDMSQHLLGAILSGLLYFLTIQPLLHSAGKAAQVDGPEFILEE